MSNGQGPVIHPHAHASLDAYGRLFQEGEELSIDAMKALGQSMAAVATPIPNPPTTLPAGYTYFGQFIDHDITRDDTYLWDAAKALPAQILNGGGGRLDLNHLYGLGPGSNEHGHLYDGPFFRLGEIRLQGGIQFDLPLNDRGEPQAADERSIENIILRQIVAMFMKLHNQAVLELPSKLSTADKFDRARTRVQWQYQWLIRREFLPLVCRKEVYEDLCGDGTSEKPQMIDWNKGFAIPVEFSHAAFRFGHSMVRAEYKLNSNPKVKLEDLFWNPKKPGAIPIERAVSWGNFFHGGGPAERSMSIDTAIVQPLFHLPSEHVHHLIAPSPPLPPELPVRTLVRGALMRLPTGEEVAGQLGDPGPSHATPPGYQTNPWAKLDDLGLTGKTPLWYYLLLEAELQDNVQGAKLGPIGSRLVAEVLDGALRKDPDSYLRKQGAGWVPPPWTAIDGTSITVKRLLDVAKVVGLFPPFH